MIERIRAWFELRRFKRAYLAKGNSPAVALYDETAGATADWSPIREVEQVGPGVLDGDDACAAAEVAVLLDGFDRAMATARRAFDAALLGPMQVTARWHADCSRFCVACAEHRARTFGAVGERFGIRSFRLDTPTAEYRIYA
jgi:hypothetical protein